MTPVTKAVRRLAVAAAVLTVASAGLAPADAAGRSATPKASGSSVLAAARQPQRPRTRLHARSGRSGCWTPGPAPTIHTRGRASTATLKVTGVGGVPSTGVGAVASTSQRSRRPTRPSSRCIRPGVRRPTASNLNVGLKRTRANEVIAQVGAGGAISFYNASGVTDVLVDMSGWFATGSSYTGRSPMRILDTRDGGAKPKPAASTTVLRVTGVASVPTTGVTAVVLNLTGISMGTGTFVTAYPTGGRPTGDVEPQPGRPARPRPSWWSRRRARAGQITLYNSGGPTHLAGRRGRLVHRHQRLPPSAPARLLDSRITGGFTAGNTQWPVQIAGRGGVPSTANAAIVTVTVVTPAAGGHVTVIPFGAKDPGYVDGQRSGRRDHRQPGHREPVRRRADRGAGARQGAARDPGRRRRLGRRHSGAARAGPDSGGQPGRADRAAVLLAARPQPAAIRRTPGRPRPGRSRLGSRCRPTES